MLNDDCSDPAEPDATAVLDFWFGDSSDPDNVKSRGKLWFQAFAEQDRVIRQRFAALHDSAQRGELDHWAASARGGLALVLLLDQLTRNLYRGTASAFANDARALALSREGNDRGVDARLNVVERAFWYMPFQHSEDIEVQRESVRLYSALLDDSPEPFIPFARNTHAYAVLHCSFVEQFGRFPHRNDLLGRRSTAQEKAYLEGGGHRFGQG